jgi:hypothetical protein
MEIYVSCICSYCQSMHYLYRSDVLIILSHFNWSYPRLRWWEGGGRVNLWCTRPLGAKTGVANFCQILDVILLRRFLSALGIFLRGTSEVGKLISLAFQRYLERKKRSPYVTWASIFVRSTLLQSELDLQIIWTSTYLELRTLWYFWFHWLIYKTLQNYGSIHTDRGRIF